MAMSALIFYVDGLFGMIVKCLWSSGNCLTLAVFFFLYNGLLLKYIHYQLFCGAVCVCVQKSSNYNHSHVSLLEL